MKKITQSGNIHHQPVFDKSLDIGADVRFRADDSLDDQIFDGFPDMVRVDAQLGVHVAPESQQAPLVTLTHSLISVGSELRVLLVDAGAKRYSHTRFYDHVLGVY